MLRKNIYFKLAIVLAMYFAGLLVYLNFSNVKLKQATKNNFITISQPQQQQKSQTTAETGVSFASTVNVETLKSTTIIDAFTVEVGDDSIETTALPSATSTSAPPTTKADESIKDSDEVISVQETSIIENQNTTNIFKLFQMMYHINAFMADIDILTEIENVKVRLDHGKHVIDIPNLNLQNTRRITFGIYSRLLYDWTIEDFIEKYDLPCKINQSNVLRNGVLSTSVIYITLDDIKIQISVFYDRGEFLWIGKDETVNDTAVWFGDTHRAMPFFTTNSVQIKNANQLNPVWIPDSLGMFLFHYSRSKFLECNRTAAEYNVKAMGKKYEQDPIRNKRIMDGMVYIARKLESFKKTYWLTDGSLLGWYRDCGIIPHTTDADFGMLASEYEPKIKETFLGNNRSLIWVAFGLTNDSYEFRLWNRKFTYDLFFAYDYNATYRYSGYHVNGRKYWQWIIKSDDICSVDLLNHKLFAPCDPISYLSNEYGNIDNWIVPKEKRYPMMHLERAKTQWTEEEWPHAIRYYDYDGELNVNKTLKALNENNPRRPNATQLVELPSDDFP